MDYEQCLAGLLAAEQEDAKADRFHGIGDELEKRVDEARRLARQHRQLAYEQRCKVQQAAESRETYERALAEAREIPV